MLDFTFLLSFDLIQALRCERAGINSERATGVSIETLDVQHCGLEIGLALPYQTDQLSIFKLQISNKFLV